jgi:D-alanyl-D-alanine carboxypeptidase
MWVPAVVALAALGACTGADGSSGSAATTAPPPPSTTSSPRAAPTTTPPTSAPPATAPPTTASPYARPAWLGTRPLPLRPDEHGEVQPTPPELVDRRLETLDLLAPPAGEEFASTIEAVPPDVLARSSWTAGCPVTVDELAYLTMTHWGFDGRVHTGEMIVNAAVAEDVVTVFAALHAARFPIEQMRVVTAEEIDAPPTGDWNDTTSFVCRPAVGSGSWSMHAYGLAVDVNPFHNPYEKGDLVLPELASAYLDREDVRPGMIEAGDAVYEAFAAIGWGWGGHWSSLKDWMHFSSNGR